MLVALARPGRGSRLPSWASGCSAPDPAPAVDAGAGTDRVGARDGRCHCHGRTPGQGAVAVPAIGVDEASGPEQPAPVASLTKLMTAYVILHDHPLALGQPGPTITVSQADVDDYDNDTVDDDSNAQVTLGRADHRGAGAERPAGALRRQLRRPAGALGRRQHPRLRGQDERGRPQRSA